MTDPRPLIAITAGDASGVGPELVVRVLAEDLGRERFRAVVLGDPAVMRENVRRVGAALVVAEIAALEEATFRPDHVEVLVPPDGGIDRIAWGEVDVQAGLASLSAFRMAADLATTGQIDALLSAPVNKQALHLAGMRQSDELALLADLTGRPDPLVIGVFHELLTVCVTLHVPLRAVAAHVTQESVAATTRTFLKFLSRLHERPRVVVVGLNPHAGDGGGIGREELDEIEPAVAAVRADGADVVGPVAPDVAFPLALAHGAHGVVCMYHDQANIARKLDGIRGATLFSGLPVPVATTAHGTAFDLAGTGSADPASMRVALDQLVHLAGGAM